MSEENPTLEKQAKPKMLTLEKVESISRILAAVLIPLAIAWMGNQISIANQQRDAQTKLVELATQILNKENTNVSADDKRLRGWAVTVINQYSGVPMSEETQVALIEKKVSLPNIGAEAESIDSQGTWGVVFGGDSTLESAKYEVDVTAKKAGVKNAQIFLRSGSYRSVLVLVSKSDAEDALGRLKSVRNSSYIVNMNKWCYSSTQREGYYECTGKE